MNQTPKEIALERIKQAFESGSNELDLKGLSLNFLPPEIGQLQNLTQLVLSFNELTTLPPEISQLQNLTQLVLMGNNFASLPPDIGQLQNLTQLDLSGNGLTTLPPEIGQLQNLTQLDLSGTGLTTLPPEIGLLKNLTILNISGINPYTISGGHLFSLPPEIGQLQNLTNLDLSGNLLTKLPPEIGLLKNLTILNISGINPYTNSGGNLFSLPPEIGQLQNLTNLDLSGNLLTTLPPEIGLLKNLTILNISGINPYTISGGHLFSLPPEIGQLQNLTNLDLSGNLLTKLPPEIGLLKNLTILNISGINPYTNSGGNLFSLPPEIGQLQNLTNLDLSGNLLTTLPPEIGQLQNLTHLYLSSNQLASLPPEICQLQNLIHLDLSENKLLSLPPEIGQLTHLTTLDIGFNQLASLSNEIGQLQNLTTLDLSSNQLASLPPEIGQLQNLTHLTLSSNQLASLPPEIGQLQNLTTLDLSSNQLASLPPEIGQLQNLTTLDLSSNQLASLPPEIGQLQNLITLKLSRNKLASLPPEIGQLQNLITLDLSSNGLASLPPEIGQLQNLTTLDLRNNQLVSLSPKIVLLTNLIKLNLSHNKLASLPKEIINMEWVQEINLRKNPLAIAIPGELLGDKSYGDAQRIFNFYKKLWEEGGRPLGEARVLVVGEGRVGKTSLVSRLLYDRFDEDEKSTLTVETHTLPFDDHRVQIWDFGGQEHMHATHQFFFSGRSLYLLVFNTGASPEQNKLEYWLNLIRTYSKDSPVILVGNQADSHRMDIEKRRLQEKYPNIRAFVETSAQSRYGMDNLKQAIHDEVHAMPQVHVELPISYLEIKEEMEEKKGSKPYIAHEQFVEACEKRNISDSIDQDNLLDLLHDLGSVLYFRDEKGEALIPSLGVLNPNWVTGGVYRILTHPKAGEVKGKLTQPLLKEILSAPEYVRHIDDIMKLLERFELCYRGSDSSYWLPSIMPRDEAETGSWQGGLTFIYEYPELPKSVIARLIVRTHEWIFDEKVWRAGVVLSKDGNRARIQADEKEKRVYIEVTGNDYSRREFLAYIRTNIDEINKNLEAPKTYIRSLRYPTAPLLDFEELRAREKTGKVWEVYDPSAKEMLMVKPAEEINGYLLSEENEEKGRKPASRARTKKGGDTNVTINIEKMEGSNLSVGDTNQLTAISNAALKTEMDKLVSAVETLLQNIADSDHKEELKENLESLQEEMQRMKPRKRFYHVSVDGLAQAAKNLNDVGKPVLELAMTVIKLINTLPG